MLLRRILLLALLAPASIAQPAQSSHALEEIAATRRFT
jgi:hypothetical protein